MSYILDSLRKSEQERRRKQDAAGTTVFPEREPVRRKRWWLWGLAAILLVNGVGLALLLRQGEQAQPAPAREQIVSLPTSETTPQGTAAKAATVKTDSLSDGQAPPSAPEATTQPDDPGRLYLYTELPAHLTTRIPAPEMTLHYFSNRAGRSMVRINGRNLHAGDLLQPGVKVAEISPDGAVLEIEGYRVWIDRP